MLKWVDHQLHKCTPASCMFIYYMYIKSTQERDTLHSKMTVPVYANIVKLKRNRIAENDDQLS